MKLNFCPNTKYELLAKILASENFVATVITAACFHVYQHDGEVYQIVVEDVSQLPGLGKESSIEETTKDLVKSFTLLEELNDSIHVHQVYV